MSQARRLQRIATQLTPQQAVIAWMAEAHQHPDLVTYVQAMIAKGASASPLQSVVDRVEQATRTALRGQPRDAVEPAVRQATRDAAFLLHLHWNLNTRVMEADDGLRLGLALVAEGLRGLLQRVQLSEDLAWSRIELARALPYPLEHDVAAALQAALAGAVMTWAALEEDGTLQGWVVDQYLAEGKTPLPPGAYLPSPSDGNQRRALLPRPSPEELRAGFRDDTSFAAFQAGADFNCGLADVPDVDVLVRTAAVEQAQRALVDQGVVAAGTVVRLPTVPLAVLQEAPLVERVWLDATVLELAEWGVLLTKHGATVSPGDDHPCAWDRIAAPPGGPSPETLRGKAQVHLRRFPGRTREVAGRRYLHAGDYDRWRGRWLSEPLLARAEHGMVIDSWNALVAARSGEGRAQLAGVPVGLLAHYAAEAPIIADEPARVVERLTERRRLLETLGRWTLATALDADHTVAGDRARSAWSLWGRIQRWRLRALELLGDLYAHSDIATLLAERYVGGEQLLFPAQAEALAVYTAHAEQLVDSFNTAVADPLQSMQRGQGTSDGQVPTDAWTLDPAILRTKGAERVRLSTGFLIDQATAQTLDEWGDGKVARALMERHLQQP